MHSHGAICSLTASELQTSYSSPPALPLQAKLRGTPISLSELCSFLPFLEIHKPSLAAVLTHGSVSAAVPLIPSDPLPIAICHLPVLKLNCLVFRSGSDIKACNSAVCPSRAQSLWLPSSGAGMPSCPQEGAVSVPCSSMHDERSRQGNSGNVWQQHQETLKLAKIPDCSWRNRCNSLGLAQIKRLSAKEIFPWSGVSLCSRGSRGLLSMSFLTEPKASLGTWH